MFENNHIVALVAVLILAYIIYKSFFADKQTVIETVTENKKEAEAVVEAATPPVTAPPLSEPQKEVVAEVAKKVARKPRTSKVAATAPKGKTKKVKKNG